VFSATDDCLHVLVAVALDPLIFDLLKLTDEELERDAVASLSEEFYWAPLSGLGHAFASLRPSKSKS
jgi:hypothetical protein